MRIGWPIVCFLLLLGVFAVASAPASAEPLLPVFDGALYFPTIGGPIDPEEYSWRVELYPGQELKAVDHQHAAIYFEDGVTMASIVTEPAHDAWGSAVPTSLRVSEGDVVTLIVHHRDGNPAAGGASFDYPVTAGSGWEGGFSPVIIVGPKDEKELREERERIERERREAVLGAGSSPQAAWFHGSRVGR